MKKTLFGILAFVLVLATVLTGTVLAAKNDDDEVTSDKGFVKMVDDSNPANAIKVDGKMDEAYASAVALPIAIPKNRNSDAFTYGYARFVWSETQNAFYCHVIINDADVNKQGSRPWAADAVELFLDFSGKGTQAWDLPEGVTLSGKGVLNRGLQYRIDGFDGSATCYLKEENANNAALATYKYSATLGRMVNEDQNKLITADYNIFGWNKSDDVTKTGWGFSRLPGTNPGYMVEFRIDPKDQGVTLTNGLTFKFDLQVDNRTQISATSYGQVNTYYSSYERVTGTDDPESGYGSCNFYDIMTLSNEKVANNGDVSDADLVSKYGIGDPTKKPQLITKATERTVTNKHVVNRVPGNVVKTEPGQTDSGNNNNATTTAKQDDTQSGGGCGSSIAAGTSVAMLALVGATGFIVFRRKEEK